MDQDVSNKTSIKLTSRFGIKNIYEDLGVTQHNNLVFHEFAKLNIEKASNKIDRKAFNTFDVFLQSSLFILIIFWFFKLCTS